MHFSRVSNVWFYFNRNVYDSFNAIFTIMSAPQCWQVESDDDGSGNEENSGQMSEYEKKIQQNVAERNKVFKLMVSEAKKDFITSLEHSSSKKHPPTTRKASKRKKEGIRYSVNTVFNI